MGDNQHELGDGLGGTSILVSPFSSSIYAFIRKYLLFRMKSTLPKIFSDAFLRVRFAGLTVHRRALHPILSGLLLKFFILCRSGTANLRRAYPYTRGP